MSFKSYLLPAVAALAVVLASCTTPKDIAYFQDMNAGQSLNVENPLEIKFRPDDKISILVSTQDLELNSMFSLYGGRSATGAATNTMNSYERNGSNYVIDQDGFIRFPILGRIHVAGLNRQELQDHIRQQLIDQNLVKDPIVTVNYENLCVTILGDVGVGRVEIDRDKFTILDALSKSGDLRITGKRTNIKVIRDNYGKKTAYEVNLCSAEDLYNSPVFYLQQNDVIYVEQNKKQKRTSTVLGNDVVTPSFWMSMASFVVTLIGWFK